MPTPRLTFVFHDCFMLEFDETVIIFDYWRDSLTDKDKHDFPSFLNVIRPDKKLYVIVSHHHKDHFNKKIFLWAQRFPNIRYIISPDVFRAAGYILREKGNYKGYKPPLERVSVLDNEWSGEGSHTPNFPQVYEDDTLKVTAFGSTDIGNSYAVEIEGYRVFHAGDLNAWDTPSNSNGTELKESRASFCKIVYDIQKHHPEFDLAMFPLDSRRGEEYWWGAAFFVRTIKCRRLVPMHLTLRQMI